MNLKVKCSRTIFEIHHAQGACIATRQKYQKQQNEAKHKQIKIKNKNKQNKTQTKQKNKQNKQTNH